MSQIGRLDYEHQRRVLDFARALAVTGPKGIPGNQLLSFAGAIPADDLKTMKQAIEDNCEKVDLRQAEQSGMVIFSIFFSPWN